MRITLSDWGGMAEVISPDEPDAANMRVVRYIVDPEWLKEHGYDA